MAGEVASAFVSLLPSAQGFGAGVEAETAGPLRGAAGNLGKILGAGLVAGGAAAGAAIVAGVVTAMDQEKDTDRMAAALGLSPEDSKRLGGVAGDLFKNAYGESFGEVTGAVEAVVSSIAGMRDASTADIEAVSAKALDFAAVFETDVARSTQVVGQLITNGLAKDATEGFDLITAASQQVPANVREDVLDAADEYGKFFAGLGIGGEEAFGLLVKGAEDGAFGIDKMADALFEGSLRLTDLSTASRDAYAAIGLDAEEMAGKIIGGGEGARDALSEIATELLGIEDPVTRANTAVALFGTPLEDLGLTKIPDFLTALAGGETALEDFEGASQRMGDGLNDNAAGNLTKFKRTITQSFVEFIGGTVLPKLDEFARFIANNIGPVIDWLSDKFEDARPTLEALAEQLLDVWVEIQPELQDTADMVMRVFDDIVSIVEDAVFIVQDLWDRFGGILIDYVVNTFENLKLIFEGAFEVIAGIFNTFAALLQGDWSGVWDGIQQIFSGAWMILTGLFQQFVNEIVTRFLLFGTAINDLLTIIWDGIKQLFVKVFGEIGARMSADVSWIVGMVVGAWTWVRDKTVELFSAVASFIFGKVQDVKGFLGGISSVVGVVIGFFTSMKDGAVEKMIDLVTWVTGIPGRITSAIGSLGSLLYNAGIELIQGLIDGIGDMFEPLGDAMGAIGGFIGGFLPGSPVREGPLTSWNNGGAGKRLMGLLADGIDAGGVDVLRATAGVANGIARVGLTSPAFTAPTISSDVTGSTRFTDAGAGGAGAGSSLIDYDRLADAMSRRPGYLTITDRTAAELQLMQDRAMADLAS